MRRRESTPAADIVAAWQVSEIETGEVVKILAGKTITPLYGGGVEAGKVDLEMPIRATAIRGHLRFWWRLTAARGLSSQDMFERESALWGGIASTGPTASKVAVRVKGVSTPKPYPAFKYVTDSKKGDGSFKSAPLAATGVVAYALFPAQGNLEKNNPRKIEKMPHEIAEAGIKFSLEIGCPESAWPEVETALRWWATFGGLGARTRRGLGALQLAELKPVTAAEVESAGGKLVINERQRETAQAAWASAVDRLRDFRQGVEIGRNKGKEANRPGRSRWPEADMVRQLSHKHDPDHEPEHPVKNLYPRAAFGLPIIFHFQSKRDPADATLEPVGDLDRMASPLILRPYPLGGDHYAPAALLIPGWQQALKSELKFKKLDNGPLKTWPVNPAQRQEAASKIKPLQNRGNDPLSAFLHFFANGGA
jgi:CRISPR-associated protein Cmr1